MNKWIYLVIALASIGASVAMYIIGSNSVHLDELLRFYWYPLGLAVLSLTGFYTAVKRIKKIAQI